MLNSEIEDIELLDKFPYMQELCRRLDDINNYINNGFSGLEQAWNLISDLPEDWLSEIQGRINIEIEKGKQADAKLRILYRQGKLTVGNRNRFYLQNERHVARNIKSITVGLLNKKKILLLTKRSVETNSLSQLDMELEPDEQ